MNPEHLEGTRFRLQYVCGSSSSLRDVAISEPAFEDLERVTPKEGVATLSRA